MHLACPAGPCLWLLPARCPPQSEPLERFPARPALSPKYTALPFILRFLHASKEDRERPAHSKYGRPFSSRPQKRWPCHRMWLFHLHRMVKGEKLFSHFPVNGRYGWGILLVIPLALREIKHQLFPMTQPMREVPYPARTGCGTFFIPGQSGTHLAAGRKEYDPFLRSNAPERSLLMGMGATCSASPEGVQKKQGRGGGHFSLLHGGFPFPAASIILDAGRIFR